MFHVPEHLRITEGFMGSSEEYGNNGLFRLFFEGHTFVVIASDGELWEHVSVSREDKRPPAWKQMCFIKDMFWDEQDVVVQYHPAKSHYINNHPGCLHLWRPIDVELPTPHWSLVGIK